MKKKTTGSANVYLTQNDEKKSFFFLQSNGTTAGIKVKLSKSFINQMADIDVSSWKYDKLS